eukprot:13025-Heterococcus_DN1.PRE.5
MALALLANFSERSLIYREQLVPAVYYSVKIVLHYRDSSCTSSNSCGSSSVLVAVAPLVPYAFAADHLTQYQRSLYKYWQYCDRTAVAVATVIRAVKAVVAYLVSAYTCCDAVKMTTSNSALTAAKKSSRPGRFLTYTQKSCSGNSSSTGRTSGGITHYGVGMYKHTAPIAQQDESNFYAHCRFDHSCSAIEVGSCCNTRALRTKIGGTGAYISESFQIFGGTLQKDVGTVTSSLKRTLNMWSGFCIGSTVQCTSVSSRSSTSVALCC